MGQRENAGGRGDEGGWGGWGCPVSALMSIRVIAPLNATPVSLSPSAGKKEHHITIIIVRSGQEALSLSPCLFCISGDQEKKTRGDEREAIAIAACGRVSKESD
ncbi:hypothetical protein ACLOJK_018480, partial [Asimina triloba]